eukprot:14261963-Heterocapsa_arctica.AAC.1
MATYGAAVEHFAQAEINALRGRYTQALWPNKCVLVNWIRQVEGGLHTGTEDNCDKYDIHTGQ